VDGRKLGTYQPNFAAQSIQTVSENLHFAGRLIKSNGQWVVTDRLGSVVKSGTENLRYFPWGEERTTTTQNRDKFGAYFRDASGLDYALNRYYSSSHGRFLTPDPYNSPDALANPQEWNRYPYVAGDPVNNIDPSGEFIVPVFSGMIGWLGRLIGIGSAAGGAIGSMPPSGGSVSIDPLGWAKASEWKRDPAKKVREWDLAIAAALAAAEEEKEAHERYPHHLQLIEDCYVGGGYGGSVMRRREYELRDQRDEKLTGPVRVTEHNFVVQGNLMASNSTWVGGRVVDYLSIGSGPVITQYQQFTAQVVSGIDIMAAPVPVMVRDPARGDFGTLGIKMEKDVIFINGDDGKVNGQLRWCR
jgi:RHS repeat-associated protein